MARGLKTVILGVKERYVAIVLRGVYGVGSGSLNKMRE